MCFIKISIWGYIKLEIILFMDENILVDIIFYSENGEWDFLFSVGYIFSFWVWGGIWYLILLFFIILRRKFVYYVLNMLFLVILMMFLIFMVYKLLIEFGEKMSYSLMVLLVYVVYFFFIFDNIFSIFKSVCFFCKYFE